MHSTTYLIVGRVGIHDGTLEYSVFIDFPLEKKNLFSDVHHNADAC